MTPIPNELLDRLVVELRGMEFRVALFIAGQTFRGRAITLDQLARARLGSRAVLRKTLHSLVEQGFLLRHDGVPDGGGTEVAAYELRFR
jgi:hypothetical protein